MEPGERWAGKPLLVFVVPHDQTERFHRGQAFGQYLAHAGDDWMADLALCEVICRTPGQLKPLVGEVNPAEPLMVLIETDGVFAEANALCGVIPSESDVDRQTCYVTNGKNHAAEEKAAAEGRSRYEASVAKRIAVLGALIRSGVAPDVSILRRRATQATGALDPAELKQVYAAASTLALPPVHLGDRAAAIIRLQAETSDSETRGKSIGLLAAAARSRLVERAPLGSRWGSSSGCGATYYTSRDPKEPEYEMEMVACGMGFVPALSGQFLDLFTESTR